MFFVNRVRTEQKGKDVHQEWTKAWIEIFTALQKYVRQAHTTGLVWNSSPVRHCPLIQLYIERLGGCTVIGS